MLNAELTHLTHKIISSNQDQIIESSYITSKKQFLLKSNVTLQLRGYLQR